MFDAREVALLQMQVRDAWMKECGQVELLKSGFDSFVQWIIQIFNKQMFDEYDAVTDYLRYLLKSHPTNFQANPDHVRTILKENTLARTYRVTAVCHGTSLGGDKRLRDLVEYIFSDQDSPISIYPLLNVFFTYFPEASHSQSKSGTNMFGTKPATTLERILFLAFLCEEHALHSRSQNTFEARKRKFSELNSSATRNSFFGRGGSSSSDAVKGKREMSLYEPCFLPHFLHKDGSSSQRAGKVLQVICRGWNFFAQYLHFKDVDEMVRPYIWFGGSPLRAHVLMDRDDGYMPLESTSRLAVNQNPVLITEQTFDHVTEYSAEVDGFLRDLALAFINDVRRGTFSANLYRKDYVIFDRRYVNYEGTPDSLPKRFKEYIDKDQRLSQLRTSRRQLLGVTSPVKKSQGSTMRQEPRQPLVNQVEITRRLSNVSGASYKRKLDALNRARSMLESTTAPTMETERERFCSFYDKFFMLYSTSYDSLETLILNDQVQHKIYGDTQLVCIDPPYNTRRLANKQNSSHDVLTAEDMSMVVEQVDQLLRPGGHAVVFCTVQQFVVWQKLFDQYKRMDDKSSNVFSVDKAPMNFVNSPNNHKTAPHRSSCTLQGMVEYALHLKKNGLSYEEEAKMVNYKTFNYINSNFGGTKNVIDNIPVVAGREALVEKVAVSITDEEDPDFGRVSTRARRVRPEQKSVHLMKELVSRFSQGGDIVVDLFAGTFSLAFACFQLPQHRVFAGCELDEDCYDQAKNHFTTQLAHYLVDTETITDIPIPEDALLSAARISISNQDNAPLLDPDWKAPNNLPKFQRLPLHVFSRIAALTGCHRHVVDHFKSYYDEWPQEMKHTLQRIPISELVAIESAAYNVYVAKSLIRHPHSGQGLFASKPFDTGDVICFYYGTLVYTDLSNRKSKTKRYADTGIMGVSVERFDHYALQVRTSGQAFDSVTDYRYGDRSVFVVPPPFCVGSYVNDYKYDEKDEERPADGDISSLPNARSPNVAIQQVPRPVSSPEKIRDTDFLPVVALKQINRGDELYADYDRVTFAK